MQKYLQNFEIAWRSLYEEMFCSPKYLTLALFVAVTVFLFSIWLPNLGLIRVVIFSPDFTFLKKALFLWDSLGAISTNFSLLTASFTLFISVLFGLNISLAVYYFKKRITFQKAGGISIAGMLVGLIGVGCASCGAIVLSTLLGVGAAAAVTGILPFGGQEFSMLSIIILLGALYITAKKATDTLVCKVKSKN